ncbi:hypothetical protein QEN19_000278 [Hanseniaspora menglaensis]
MISPRQNTYLNIRNILDFETEYTPNVPSFSNPNAIIDVIKNEYINKLILSNQLKINNLKKMYNILINDTLSLFFAYLENDDFQNTLKINEKISAIFKKEYEQAYEMYLKDYKPIIKGIAKEIHTSYQVIKETLKIIIEFDMAVKNNNSYAVNKWMRDFTTLLTLDYKHNVLEENIFTELKTIESNDDSAWDYSVIILNNNNFFLYDQDVWSLVDLDKLTPDFAEYTELNHFMNCQFDQIQCCFFDIQKTFIVTPEDKIYFNNLFSEYLRIFMCIQTITNNKEISIKKLSDFKVSFSNLHKNDYVNSQFDFCLSTIIDIICGNNEANDFSSTLSSSVEYYNFFKNCVLLPKLFHLSNKITTRDPNKVTSSFFELLVKLGYSSLVSNQCYHNFLLKDGNENLFQDCGISKFIFDLILANSCPCCKYFNIVKSKTESIFDGTHLVRNVATGLSHIDNKSLVEIIPSAHTKTLMGNKIIGYNNLVDVEQYKRFNENMSQLFGCGSFSFHVVFDFSMSRNTISDIPIDYLKNKSVSFKKLWSSLNSKEKHNSHSDAQLKLGCTKTNDQEIQQEYSQYQTYAELEIKKKIANIVGNKKFYDTSIDFSLNSNEFFHAVKKAIGNMLIVSEPIQPNEYAKAYIA